MMEESQASTLAGERRRSHRALRILVADDDSDTVKAGRKAAWLRTITTG